MSAATISVSRGRPSSNEGLRLAHYYDVAAYSGGGYYIGVGIFASPPVRPADLLSFVEFASGRSPTSGVSTGYISGSFTGIPSDPTIFDSKEIYIVVGNAATFAECGELVVLRSSGAPWLFPASTDAASSTTIIVRRSDVTGVAIEGMEPVFLEQPEGPDLIAMGPLTAPEPSTFLLAGLGIAFLGRRERHS